MRQQTTLSLKNSVSVLEEGDDLWLACRDGKGLRLSLPGPALRNLVSQLEAGGLTADELSDAAARRQADADPALLYYTLAMIEEKGFVCYTLAPGGHRLAMLEPMSAAFRLAEPAHDGKFRLSRFACLRRLDDAMLLESPLGHARLLLHDARATGLLALLAEPRSAAELEAQVAGLDLGAVLAFIGMAASAQAIFPCDADGSIAEDRNVPLTVWEFHDLLFHTRSRIGRHDYPAGGTLRFRDMLAPLPAIKPSMSARRVTLHRPDMAALDMGDLRFSEVLELRRTIRRRGEHAIDAAQLGDFLYRVARVRQINPARPGHGAEYESSMRPCASGGAVHEIELYLTLSRCNGIAPGFYHYDPMAHELEHLHELGPAQQRLLADARVAAGMEVSPDVLFTLAARFQRGAWKYQSLAYALTLKNVGALYQQMYLVATAMRLAPCGLGGGDSDLFAQAAGLDFYAETSVGEFLLSR
jgi:SagB-type dehydrogenase family enzyme